jgi:hypothetical protein
MSSRQIGSRITALRLGVALSAIVARQLLLRFSGWPLHFKR